MENLVDFKKLFTGVYSGKRVLITGNTGFKGSWLSHWLIEMGAEVKGISLEPNTTPNHFEELNLSYSTDFIDINNVEELKQSIISFSPEIIFHLAAQPLVRESYSKPIYTFNTNMIGTAHILEIGRSCKNLKAILIVTTDKCYENKEQTYAYKESDPMGGFDPYSASKACSELITKSYQRAFYSKEKYKMEHQTLIATARAGNVIGGGDWSKDRLIPDIIKATEKLEAVTIRSPKSIRPWQHVLESLSAYLHIGQGLLNENLKYASEWNIGPTDNTGLTVKEVLEESKRCWPQINFEIKSNDDFHEAKLLMLDTNKIKSQLGWISIWDSNQAILKSINWYKIYNQNQQINTQEDLNAYVLDAVNAKAIWT